MRKLKFIAVAFPVLFAVLAIATCSSCKTVKLIEKEKTIVDSSVVIQNEGLQRTLQETIERYEAEKDTWLKTGVLFDTVYRKDTVIVNRVTFDNGRIKSIEGRILAVNTDLHERTAELYDAHSTIDSLSYENEKLQIELSKKVTTVARDVKRSVPWWAYILCAIAGMLIEWKVKIIQRIAKFLKYYV